MNKKILIVGIAVFLACLVLIPSTSTTWANISYTNAKNITLLGADTELTNYPYAVSNAKESSIQSDYDDLIFYDWVVYNSNLIDLEER